MLGTKKGNALFTATLGALYLVLFFIHYLFSVSGAEDITVEIVSYLIYLILTAGTAFCAYLFHCKKEEGPLAYLTLLLLFSMRLFYQIPYYFVYYITDAYSVFESIVLGVMMGIVDLICHYGAFVFLSFLLSRFGATGEKGAPWLALCLPLYEFILLLVEVVLYIKQYSGVIFTEDIAYFVFGFLSPALMFTAAFALMLVLRKFLKTPFEKGE